MDDVGPLPRASGKLTGLIVVVVVLALAVAGTFAPSDATTDATSTSVPSDQVGSGHPTIGELAPDFTVPLLDGGSFSLAEHIQTDGRPIVLNFWASWCGPCREEMPAFDLVSQEKPALLVLGVAINDTPEAASDFADVVQVSYPLAIDNEGTVNERYPSLGLPTTWLIAADGTLVNEFVGQVNAQTLREIISAEFGF